MLAEPLHYGCTKNKKESKLRKCCGKIPGVRFKPWIGLKYKKQRPRFLIVGQSHYDWKARKQNHIPLEEVTCQVIEDYISIGKKAFFTKITSTVLGKRCPNENGRSEFWDSVAYYNFIQEFVGSKPRLAHSYKLWHRNHDAFLAVLKCLRPDLILVLGRTNYLNGPPDGHPGEPLPSGPRRYRGTWFYPTDSRTYALAFFVKHPSTGYAFEKFVALVEGAKARYAQCKKGGFRPAKN